MSCATTHVDQRAAASARDLSALLCYDDLAVTAIVDGLQTAISLNDLADCLVGAKNELVEFLHVYNATARKPGQAPSDPATLIAERLDQSFQALKRDVPALLSALQRELPSTPFLDLPLSTQQRLNALNTMLATFERQLASWAINAFAAVASDPRLKPPDQHEGWLECTDCFYFTALFARTTSESEEPFGERYLRFRLPGALCRNDSEQPREDEPAVRFQNWADRRRWLDLSQNPPVGFEPCELIRVLYEHGALGWAQLALVREIQVSFDRSSSECLVKTL